jgi:hypothetical protein
MGIKRGRKTEGGSLRGTRGSHLHGYDPLPRKILSLESPDLAHYLLVRARDVLGQLTKHVMALGLPLGIECTQAFLAKCWSIHKLEQPQTDKNDSHGRRILKMFNTHLGTLQT